MAEENQNNQEQQMETVAKSDYDKVVAELEEVKTKLPKELSEEEKLIQEKQQKLFDKEIYLTLKENGLEQFKSVLKIESEEELKQVVEELTKIVNNIKLSTGYIPADHKNENEYDIFAKNKDTKGMIATKLSKLFN